MKRLRPGDVPRGDESATYYATGTEARSAGLADIDEPSPEARARIRSLIRRGVASHDWADEDAPEDES